MLRKLLRERLGAYRWVIAAMLVFQAVQTAATLVLPTLSARLIDNGVLKHDTAYIRRIGVEMLAFSFVQIIFAVVAVYLGARVAMGFGRDVRNAMFHQVTAFSSREVGAFGAPSLITRVTNDVQQVQLLVVMVCTMAIAAPLTLIFGVIAALHQDVRLSVIVAFGGPLAAILLGAVVVRMVPAFRLMQERIDQINRILRGQITGLRVIRAFVREPEEEERFAQANADLTDTAMRAGRLMATMFPTVNLVTNWSSVAVLWLGAMRIQEGTLQVGALIAYLSYLIQILMAVVMATFMFSMIPRASVSAGRIQEVIDTDPTVRAPDRPRTVRRGETDVELRQVGFHYPGAEHPVLTDVSFTTLPGETTAIVGSTGAGKSTLINLIPRLFDVTAGSVRIAGVDVRELNTDFLWSIVGLVPQRTHLFTGTIASNLAYGQPDASEADMWEALEVAQAADFVRLMRGQLDAHVDQGGANLSGGQRQRLSIARALVRKPDIYLFDDSFSALDLGTEARLRAALGPYIANSVVLIVTQRVSTIATVDRIVVLEDGEVVGIGSDAELRLTCPTYAEIVQSQIEVKDPGMSTDVTAGRDDQEDQEDLRTLTSQQPRAGGGRWQSMAAPTERSCYIRAVIRRLVRLLAAEGPKLVLVAVTSVAGVTLNVLGPLLLGHATDLIVSGSLGHGIDFSRLHTVLLEAAALYAGSAVLTLFSVYTLTGVVQRLMQNLRRSVEAKIHALPLSYIDRGSWGDLLSRVTNDIDNLAQSLQQTMSQMLNSLLLVVGVAIMMFTISPLLAAVALTTVPISIYAMRTIARRARPRFISQWRATGALNGIAEEVFSGHAVVKAFGRQREVEARFRATNDELYDSAFRAQFMSSVMQPVTMFLGNIQYLLVAVVGGLRVASGAITIGDVQALIQYTRQFSMPITQLASMMNLFQSGMASLERVLEVLDAEEESPDPLPLPSRPTRGRVAFEDVTFSYHPRVRLIESLSLVAEAGETVAIVGPTGAGKTTLVNLLMRFYEVGSGRITVDGSDIASMPRAQLRAKMGMVLQDTWLFAGTIRDNIAFGRPGATEEEIRQAAEATYVDRFVHSLPDGYDTLINEEADNISAGQKQLITIARAFLARPSVLILDEATSSVDTRTEVQIQLAMNRLRSQRTSFVIAHRLSTIRGADIILVMEDGSIVEQGSHTELLARDGAYARLYKSQFSAPVAEVD